MIRQRLKKELSFPNSAPGFCPSLYLLNFKELLVENHGGIIEYTPELIALNSSSGSIYIEGRQLKVKAMNKKQIIIEGSIEKLFQGGAL